MNSAEKDRHFPGLKFTDLSHKSTADLWHLLSIVVKKVLIVEDDNDLVRLLKYNLEKEGFKVNYATDGAVALSPKRGAIPRTWSSWT